MSELEAVVYTAHLDLVPVMEGRSRLDLGIKGALHPDAPIDTPSNWALRVQGKAEQPLPNYQLYNAASDQPERKKDEGKLEKAAQVVVKHEYTPKAGSANHAYLLTLFIEETKQRNSPNWAAQPYFCMGYPDLLRVAANSGLCDVSMVFPKGVFRHDHVNAWLNMKKVRQLHNLKKVKQLHNLKKVRQLHNLKKVKQLHNLKKVKQLHNLKKDLEKNRPVPLVDFVGVQPRRVQLTPAGRALGADMYKQAIAQGVPLIDLDMRIVFSAP
ncbi:MAG: hypothetical protein WDW38_007646 [Sanguina aurantia]